MIALCQLAHISRLSHEEKTAEVHQFFEMHADLLTNYFGNFQPDINIEDGFQLYCNNHWGLAVKNISKQLHKH